MRETRIHMNMPVTIEVVDTGFSSDDLETIFDYFKSVEDRFSFFRPDSEVTKINEDQISENEYSEDMKEIFRLAEETKFQTNGYFDIITRDGKYNPSGIVKGWAILNASRMLTEMGFKNHYVEAGGDIQVSGKNSEGKFWTIGIRNPFKHDEVIKRVQLKNSGIATSGTYLRGQHIYNPFNKTRKLTDIVSITVIAKNVLEADRFATAVFAMEREGINFLEDYPGLEGYMIDKSGIATMTSGFEKHIV